MFSDLIQKVQPTETQSGENVDTAEMEERSNKSLYSILWSVCHLSYNAHSLRAAIAKTSKQFSM